MSTPSTFDPRNGVAVITGAAGGIGANARLLVGRDAVGAAWLQRLFPVGYWKPMARSLARQLARPLTRPQ